MEYDKNFIDNNFYNLNIATQIPLPDYKRGITSFKYCSSKSECKEFIEEINNIIIEINKSLWNVTEGFIGKYMKMIILIIDLIYLKFLAYKNLL